MVVSRRHPTLGETSSAAVRALAAGKPLIVYDQGWYGELPDDLCLKVPPLDPDMLLNAMLSLVRDPGKRRSMGQAAVDFANQHLDPRRIARLYVRFLEEVLETAGSTHTMED